MIFRKIKIVQSGRKKAAVIWQYVSAQGIIALISTSPVKNKPRHGFKIVHIKSATAIEYTNSARSAARTPALILFTSPQP